MNSARAKDMDREHSYEVKVSWTGGKDGSTRSYASYSREHVAEVAGKPPLLGSADPAFKGDPRRHNPEDLLVASLSACHMLTYLAHAARSGLRITSYEDVASGVMVTKGDGGAFKEVVLRPVVTMARESDVTLARELHEKAHRDCYIASSVSFRVRHEPQFVVE